ncbi:MFS transporter [Arthrobacter ginkgonis]|uniref:MFS transporter n=1 Tax=Arthrobacter ginkgonis TaxID=1630594 RepID=A0ABP7DE32_9MICC
MTTALQPSATGTKTRPVAGWRQVSLAMFAVAWGGNQFTPLLSMYRAESAFSEVTVNVLLFAYVVGLVPSLLASPAVATRFGGKKPLAAAVSLSALGSLLLMAGASAPALMFLARTLSGVALGLGMVVGGLALKALAVAAAERTAPGARQPSAARTSAMGLTAGFGLGAGLAGIVAQWLPLPTLLPYVLHLAVCTAAGVGMFRFRPAGHRHDGGGQHAPRSSFSREYLLAVLPAAPLIFGALGIAYAVLPSVVAAQLGGFSTAFSALLCLLCLGLGFAAQRVVAHLSARRRVPARMLGVVLFVAGTALAVAAATGQSVGLVVLAAAVFGIGYGLTLIGCLQDCDRLALPGQLGPMTSLVYSLAYIGFGLPTAIAWLHESFGFRHTSMLAWIAAIAAAANLTGALAAKARRP